MTADICILGIFVADATFRGPRAPEPGETVLGSSFQLGPGGKGSNQSVAAAKTGGKTCFLTRLGQDTFADMAMSVWESAGVIPDIITSDSATGAASIFVNENTGQNAIIVAPGAAGEISVSDLDHWAPRISAASVFMTQLEQPLEAANRGLEIARAVGVTTILNPSPVDTLSDQMLALCDYITPNETEAEALTGCKVTSLDHARKAGDAFLARGVGTAIITLGERGVLIHNTDISELVPAMASGPVRDTTGAGDAFSGGFVTALSLGMSPISAVQFGAATAGISVTRPGAAASMPDRAEVLAFLGEKR